jgi:hypothetical protein
MPWTTSGEEGLSFNIYLRSKKGARHVEFRKSSLNLFEVVNMARATRSSTTQLQSDQQKTKQSAKKRKRTSLQDNDDHPPLKHSRIKEENINQDDDNITSSHIPDLHLAADVPINTADAQHILDILEL